MGFEEEIWRDIPDYESLYQVSSWGRIKSLDKYIFRRNKQVLIRGKILKLNKNVKGYLRVCLFRNNKRRGYYIHRLVLMVFNRSPKDNEECNHKDGDKSNNHLSNLEWMTHYDNMLHCREVLNVKVDNRGEKCGNSKLKEEQVKEIRDLLKCGKLTQKEIAKIYKVKNNTISYIKTGKTWKEVYRNV
jgi:predicted XRE-type DNA-binding protein